MCLVIGAICHRLGPSSYNRRPEDQKRGIRWTTFSALEDADFAYDLALLSHTRLHMQEKTEKTGHAKQDEYSKHCLDELKTSVEVLKTSVEVSRLQR